MSQLVKLSIACLSLIICSCGVINFKYKTPETPSKYAVFTIKDSLKGFNSSFRSCYDVTHYDIDLVFDLKQKALKVQ